jgi:hypothetical protein
MPTSKPKTVDFIAFLAEIEEVGKLAAFTSF